MIDTYGVLILSHMVLSLPLIVWIMVGFFSEKELDQLGIWHQPILNRDGTPVERDTFLFYPENAEKSPIVQDFIAMVEKEFEE